MKDLGLLSYMVGLRFEMTKNHTSVSQELYARDILERFGHTSCHSSKAPLSEGTILYPATDDEQLCDVKLYQSIVGSLMYLNLGTSTYLSFTISQLTRHMVKPTVTHMKAAEQALRYVKHTQNEGLNYSYHGKDDQKSRRAAVIIEASSDADWAGDKSDSKSTSGYLIRLAHCPIIWKSQKQKSVAKSSAEAETASSDSCGEDVIWSRNMCEFLGFKQQQPTTLFMDNEAAISGIKNGNTTARNKYYRVRIDVMHDAYVNKLIDPVHKHTSKLTSDGLTKSNSAPKLLQFKQANNIFNVEPINYGQAGVAP